MLIKINIEKDGIFCRKPIEIKVKINYDNIIEKIRVEYLVGD